MATTVRRERVRIGPQPVDAELGVPAGAVRLVVFAPDVATATAPDRVVALVLQAHGTATLLLSGDPRVAAMGRPDRTVVAVLGQQVEQAVDWLAMRPRTGRMRVGLYGASVGGAAALVAAAGRMGRVLAVVSRGARVELARDCLDRIDAPTLLIVGAADDPTVLKSNRAALRRMQCHRRLEVLPGASQRFDEPGALRSVAALAAEWFETYLGQRP